MEPKNNLVRRKRNGVPTVSSENFITLSALAQRLVGGLQAKVEVTFLSAHAPELVSPAAPKRLEQEHGVG